MSYPDFTRIVTGAALAGLDARRQNIYARCVLDFGRDPRQLRWRKRNPAKDYCVPVLCFAVNA